MSTVRNDPAKWLLRSALAAAMLSPPTAGAQDKGWPQLLGPARNGASSATGVVPKGAASLRVAWKVPIGVGTSGLAVEGERVVTLESDGAKVFAVALSAVNGTVAWRVALEEGLPDEDRGPGSTPAIADGRVFVVSPACTLRALDLADGKTVWQVDLKARFGAAPRQGCSSAPLVEGGLVVLQPGAAEDNRVVAVQQKTGAVAWTAKGVARANYSSPGVRGAAGGREVLVHHTDTTNPQAPLGGITAVNAADGSLRWHTTLDKFWSWSTPMPFGEDRVLLLTWNDATAYRVPASGASPGAPLWKSAAFSYYVGLPVYHDGHLYGVGGDFLRCVRAADGVTVWEEKTYPASVGLVDGHLVVDAITAGLVRLVEATPAGYKEKARVQALAKGARAETPPSLVGRRIFVRNDEEVAAVEIVG